MILFIWIPKTGGTTISRKIPNLKILLDQNCYGFNNAGNVTFGHSAPAMLLQKRIISADYWNKALKFAVVRNPYDRFISLYFDFQRSGRISPRLSMLAFASALQHSPRTVDLNNAFGFSQCAAQINWVVPGVTVYKFESYFANEIETHNAGKHLPYLDYFAQSKELREAVTDIYREDFIIFNYKIL